MKNIFLKTVQYGGIHVTRLVIRLQNGLWGGGFIKLVTLQYMVHNFHKKVLKNKTLVM